MKNCKKCKYLIDNDHNYQTIEPSSKYRFYCKSLEKFISYIYAHNYGTSCGLFKENETEKYKDEDIEWWDSAHK